MPLKVYTLQLKNEDTVFSNQRKIEHLLVKYSGIKISLNEAIVVINSVRVGRETEVLFNSDKLPVIEAAFEKYDVVVLPKIKV